MSPPVTVLMAVRDGGAWLHSAVESILSQTMGDFHFLVVNDGSTDGSQKYLDSIADPRVRVIHGPPTGLGASLNTGLAQISTPWVARMDADDVALPARLQRQLAWAQRHPNVGFFGSHFAFTTDGVQLGPSPPMPLRSADVETVLARGGHAICHPTLFCRTDLLQMIGGYRVQGVGEDWDLYLRLSEQAAGGNVSDVLLLYRLHLRSSALRHAEQTVLGKQWALRCRDCRRVGLPEPTFESFVVQCQRGSPLRRLKIKSHAAAEVCYRHSLIHRLAGRHLQSTFWLGTAAVCHPAKIPLRLMRRRMA